MDNEVDSARKSPDQIKAEVAKSNGYSNWEECIKKQSCFTVEALMDKVMKRYSSQFIKRIYQLKAENYSLKDQLASAEELIYKLP